MIHKLLCKMNIHKYIIKPEFIYSHTRKIEPYREISLTKLEDIKGIKVCYYCGKKYVGKV